MFHWNERGCRKVQARLEDYVGSAPEAVEADRELSAHLRECGKCREAFATAQLSGRIFAAAEEPPVQASPAFVTRVMALVREQEETAAATAAAWRPLEALASRFSLVAAIVLLALSVFLGEFSPALRQGELLSSTVTGAEMIGDWPEPPAQPATQDEVLMSIVGMDNGI